VKRALVLVAGWFIASHLVKRLQAEGYRVRGVDLEYPEFSRSPISSNRARPFRYAMVPLRRRAESRRWLRTDEPRW
jgi:nucleoside-diphosphate-sugar epimerase